MAKTTKTTQTNKAAEMYAAAEKALADKRKTVRPPRALRQDQECHRQGDRRGCLGRCI